MSEANQTSLSLLFSSCSMTSSCQRRILYGLVKISGSWGTIFWLVLIKELHFLEIKFFQFLTVYFCSNILATLECSSIPRVQQRLHTTTFLSSSLTTLVIGAWSMLSNFPLAKSHLAWIAMGFQWECRYILIFFFFLLFEMKINHLLYLITGHSSSLQWTSVRGSGQGVGKGVWGLCFTFIRRRLYLNGN